MRGTTIYYLRSMEEEKGSEITRLQDQFQKWICLPKCIENYNYHYY